MPFPYFNESKAAQAAAYLLYRGGGRLPVIKLVKLLYLAERLSLQRYGEPLTGDRLVSMPHGPVLSHTYNLIQGAYECGPGGWDAWVADRSGHDVELADSSLIRSPEQDLTALSDSDLEVLGETWAQYGHWEKFKLRDYTHSDACPEWRDPNGSSAPITYFELLRATGYSVDDASALAKRITERQNLAASMAD